MRGRAVAIWEKAATTDILAGAGMSDMAIMMLIESYATLGRHAEAEALAKRSFAREQKGVQSGDALTSSYSLVQLARSVAAQGRLEEADKIYKRAIALERKLAPAVPTRPRRMAVSLSTSTGPLTSC